MVFQDEINFYDFNFNIFKGYLILAGFGKSGKLHKLGRKSEKYVNLPAQFEFQKHLYLHLVYCCKRIEVLCFFSKHHPYETFHHTSFHIRVSMLQVSSGPY